MQLTHSLTCLSALFLLLVGVAQAAPAPAGDLAARKDKADKSTTEWVVGTETGTKTLYSEKTLAKTTQVTTDTWSDNSGKTHKQTRTRTYIPVKTGRATTTKTETHTWSYKKGATASSLAPPVVGYQP